MGVSMKIWCKSGSTSYCFIDLRNCRHCFHGICHRGLAAVAARAQRASGRCGSVARHLWSAWSCSRTSDPWLHWHRCRPCVALVASCRSIAPAPVPDRDAGLARRATQTCSTYFAFMDLGKTTGVFARRPVVNPLAGATLFRFKYFESN